MYAFFTKYRPVSKNERDLSRKYGLLLKNARHTQVDYSRLSYEINIYTPAFRHFEKTLLMWSFFTKYRPVSKNERDLSRIYGL